MKIIARMGIAAAAIWITAATLSPTTAHADIILPSQEVCMDKAENDPCDFDGTPGHCEKAQRCRALPDGGESCRDSLNCVPGAAPKTEEPAPAEDPAKGDPAPTTEQPAPEDTKSSGGCAHSSKGSASAAPSGGALSMLSLIAGLGLLAGVKRRRSRSSL